MSFSLYIQDIQSENRQVAREAFKRLRFECEMIDCNDLFDQVISSNIESIILIITANDGYPESCREMAAYCLVSIFSRLLQHKISNIEQNLQLIKCSISHFMNLSQVCHSRIRQELKHNTSRSKPLEASEEVRLLLLKNALIIIDFWACRLECYRGITTEANHHHILLHHINQMYETVTSALLDQCPELKRLGCHLLMKLSLVYPMSALSRFEELLSVLIGLSSSYRTTNMDILRQLDIKCCVLYHRHAKTRVLALQTVAELFRCYESPDFVAQSVLDEEVIFGMMHHLSNHILNNLEATVPYDGSALVRAELPKLIGVLMKICMERLCTGSGILSPKHYHEVPNIVKEIFENCMSRLILLFCMCLSDESENIRDTTKTQLNEIRCDLPNMIYTHILTLLPLITENIDSNPSKRCKIRLLESMSEVLIQSQAQNDMTQNHSKWIGIDIGRIMSMFTKALGCDDKEVYLAVHGASQALGRIQTLFNTVNHEIKLALTMDKEEDFKRNERAIYMVSSAKQCSAMLYILSAILNGSTCRTITYDSEIGRLLHFLSNSDVITYMYQSVDCTLASLNVIKSLTMFDLMDEVSSYSLARFAVYVLGRSDACKETFQKHDIMEMICHKNLKTSLLDEHFLSLHNGLTVNYTKWVFGDNDLCAFDALLRCTNKDTVCMHFKPISAIFEYHLAKSVLIKPITKDEIYDIFQTKLFIMALLESIITDESCTNERLHLFSYQLIQNSLIPNLIWQPGGAMSSATRKLAVVILYSLLQNEGISEMTMSKITPVLMPTLITCLDDDDVSTKELVALSMARMFETFHFHFSEEFILNVYHPLIKCLDDSSQFVRIASCKALKQFLQLSLPTKTLQQTILKPILEALLVHLDDPQPIIQENVYEVLITASMYDVDLTFEMVSKSLAICVCPTYYQKFLNELERH